MNVLNKVTLQSLKRSRTRTIVTIVGIILSVAMTTAVTSFIASLQDYVLRSELSRAGDWHVEFLQTDSEFAEKRLEDEELENAAVMQNVGYAKLSENQSKKIPYLFVAGLDENAYGILPVDLTEGRIPKSSDEIVIPWKMGTDNLKRKIGDKLTLYIGKRFMEGEEITQDTLYQSWNRRNINGETFQPGTAKTYTIVGIYKVPDTGESANPEFTVMTAADMKSGQINVFAKLKAPGEVYQYTKQVKDKYEIGYNDGLLQALGYSDNEDRNRILYSFAAILIGLISVGSVLLIYNSFGISVSERSRQFGILSSVGATKKQLRKSVLFEGFCVGIIGIPLGVLAGLGGIGITLHFTGSIFEDMSVRDIPLYLTVSAPAMGIAAAVGLVTILISAYIPARRAVRKPPIEIIRQADDIKIKARSVKTSRLTQKIFGLEGTLALKNFKRNKKRYRSTVISLFVSIVLFIAASSFGLYMNEEVSLEVTNAGYDVAVSIMPSNPADNQDTLQLYDNIKNVNGVTESAYSTSSFFNGVVPREELNDWFFELPENLNARQKKIDIMPEVHFLDDNTYRKYLDELGLSEKDYGLEQGKFISYAKGGYLSTQGMFKKDLVSISMKSAENEGETADPAKTSGGEGESADSVKGSGGKGDTAAFFDQEKTIELQFADTIPELFWKSEKEIGLFVFVPYSLKDQFVASEENFQAMELTFKSTDSYKSANEMKDIIENNPVITQYSILNIAEMLEVNRNLMLLIDVFVYGFVILISLITIANVFNTISTGISLRRREIAMLQSVGMGNRSFNKMMNFECLFYGLKAILYGMPVAFLLTYLMYLSVKSGGSILPFMLPWGSIGISVISIFFVVFVTMLYATGKLKKTNVIDALRDD